MPTLPQEIINLIVDLVALNKSQEKVQVYTLHACSLVSRRFRHPSLRHLFSDLVFHAKNFSQKRAQRLFDVLKNDDLVLSIRGFKLIIDVQWPSPQNMFSEQLCSGPPSRATLLPVVRHIGAGIRTNYLLKVLERLGHLPSLENFVIEAQNKALDWSTISKHTRSLFLAIRSSPSLKTLRLSNIKNIESSFILGKEPSKNLVEVELRHITLPINPLIGRTDPHSNADWGNLAEVERLYIHHKMRLKWNMVLPEFPSYINIFPYRSASCLPHLKTLVFNFPKRDEQELFWENAVKPFASSLENLEIRDICFFWCYPPIPPSICLSDLINLRNLKFTASNRYILDLDWELLTITNFLTSATPIAIECMTIDLEFELRIGAYNSFPGPRTLLHPGAGVNALDVVLTSPALLNLRKIIFNIQMTGFPAPTHDPRAGAEMIDEEYMSSLFPAVSASPYISLEVSTEIAYHTPSKLLTIIKSALGR